LRLSLLLRRLPRPRLLARRIEHLPGIDLRHGVFHLAHPGPEAAGHLGDALGAEQQREDAHEDDDLPDPEAERHPLIVAATGAAAASVPVRSENMEIPGFVDVHSHVVPSGDDGATSIEQGLELCRLAFEAGTRVLFATPHAHAAWDTYPRTPARERIFAAAYPTMRDTVATWGLDLRRGWEVYPSVIADSDPFELRLEGTNAVLVEFPGWWLDVADAIPLVTAACERIEAVGLVPVLAHPERCPAVSHAPELVAPLAERGWPLCLNAPSLLGEHGVISERTAWRLLDDGVISLAASDAHRFERPPTLDRAFLEVERRYGRDRALPLFDGSALRIDA